MENKINVVVAERNYTLTTSDESEYVKKVAEFVDGQIAEIAQAAHASTLDAAIMCALNIADGYFKELEAAENLRKQVKQYLDEATQIKLELSETKRELFRLQQQGGRQHGNK